MRLDLSPSAAHGSVILDENNQRKQSIYCYLIAIVLFISTDDYDCSDVGRPSKYHVSYKWWIIVYMVITIGQLSKFYLVEKLQTMQDLHRITYH
jgi:hypothetical protein